ncbi:MAG TPA: hypothetical protein DCP97_01870 [Ruminococcaceae bacterium]|nr:hypothetical protein [Oscillospiraceae bacterium]
MFSNFVTQKVLDCYLNKQTITPPSALYFALMNTDPTPANTGIEVSGSGYSRVPITGLTYAQLVSGKMTVSNTARITLPEATGNWTEANYWAIYDAQTGGNLITYEALATKATVLAGQQPKVEVGGLVVTLV